MANGNLKSSAVFKMYLKNSQIQFELKKEQLNNGLYRTENKSYIRVQIGATDIYVSFLFCV